MERTATPGHHLGPTNTHFKRNIPAYGCGMAACESSSNGGIVLTPRAFSKPECLLKRHNAFQLQAVFGAKHLRTVVENSISLSSNSSNCSI